MFLPELITALLIAFLFSIIMIFIMGWKRPGAAGAGAAFIFIFFILLFSVWAMGSWITPFGPVIYDLYILPFLLVGFFMMLIIIALIPPPRFRRRKKIIIERKSYPETEKEAQAIDEAAAESEAETVIGFFFWILLLGLFIAIIVRYLGSI